MNKEKTGELIREARIKKNYTQSELGDLLGVTNKAVSRWEKGESFPDVGVLENLSSILELKIQDIVTGNAESEEDDKKVITDIIRFARMQQKEKSRGILGCVFAVPLVLCCLISGVVGLTSINLNETGFGLLYIILMTITFGLIIYRCKSQSQELYPDESKSIRCMKYISVISLAWGLVVTWTYIIMISNGHVPFGMELSYVGPSLNNQLIVIFVINLDIMLVQMYRNVKKGAGIHWSCLTSVAAIYLTALYGDMLHRLMSIEEVYRILAVRSIIVIVELLAAIVLYRLDKKEY